MRQSSKMNRSSATRKSGKDFDADNIYRRSRRNLVLNDKLLRSRGKVIISKATKSPFIPKYKNRLSSIVTHKLIRANLLQEVGSNLSLKQSSSVPEQQKRTKSLLKKNITSKLTNRKPKVRFLEDVQVKKKVAIETDGISESFLSESPRKAIGDDKSSRPINFSLLSFSSDNEADQSSDASEADCVECNFSERKVTNDGKWPNLNSLTNRQSTEKKVAEPETPNENFDTNLSYYSLESLPHGMEYDKEDFIAKDDTVEKLVDVINTFENFSIAFPKTTSICHASVIISDSLKKDNGSKSNLENIVTAKLMGDIDLHLELENYLKAVSTCDETVSCKVRTKNTLQQNRANCESGENTDFEGSNVIENKLRKSVSADQLNYSENSENTNDKKKSMREDSVSGQLFNEPKIKSSFSFESVLSIGTLTSSPRDKNLEKPFFICLDREIENCLKEMETPVERDPVLQEYMDSKPTKDCASHTFSQILEEDKNVTRTKSENGVSIPLQQDIKVKSNIKRTVGEISLQPPQLKTTPPVVQSVKVQKALSISSLKDTQGEPERNLYEEISPLEPYCEEKLKPNTKSSVLFKSSFYSTSADSNRIGIDCDSTQLHTNFSPTSASLDYSFDSRVEETIEEKRQSESILSERTIINNSNGSPDESIKSQPSLTTLNSNAENWSPSLQELIEIYNSVLRQNRKIRRCNIKRVKRSISNYLISFIHDKIKEKMQKRELINFAKERIGDSKLKIENISKLDVCAGKSKNCEKTKFSELVEYVNRFQEVLSSSLSINQITQLNNIMADVQDSCLKNCIPTKIVNKKKTNKKIKTVTSIEKSSKSSAELSRSKQKNFKSDSRVKKIKDVRDMISFRTNKIQKRKSSKIKTPSKLKSVKEVHLPPSAELESVLKSYLTNSEKTVRKEPQPRRSTIQPFGKKKNKFLLNVKLCENKIIVNGMRQFKSEKALSKAPLPSEKETSDLIVENVSNKQIEQLKCSKKKSSKLVSLNKDINNKKKFKKPEVKTSKVKNHRFKTGDKKVRRKSKESSSEEDEIKTKKSISYNLMEKVASTVKIFQHEEPLINEFEYDHNLLKIQHPIEAIVESSESKIIEKTVVNCNEFSPSQGESKFHIEGEITKDGNDVLSGKELIVVKSLTKNSMFSNVGSGEQPSVSLQRTRSYLPENSQKIKSRALLHIEKNLSRKKIAKPGAATKTFSSQSSNKSSPKKNKGKILLSRPRSTYLCYPYLQCIQGDKMKKSKTGGKNKKPEDEYALSSRQCSHMNTDSNRKSQNKTKVLKNISKGLSNIFKRPSEKGQQKSKTSKQPTAKTISAKKKQNSKILEDILNYPVSNPILEEDVQSKELYSCDINELNNVPCNIVRKCSFESLTSSERSAQEPTNSESDKYSTFGSCSNRLKEENPEGNHSDYCNIKDFRNFGIEDDEYNCARVKRSFTSQNSSGTTDSYKKPMVVIHARNDRSGDISFPSLMALSESFLKCYSSFALSKTKIKSLFKSHSDMKFYPGKVVDNPEEQNPLVTFVLTPKQKDEAGLPDYQTQVVTKARASEEKLQQENNEEDFNAKFEEITHESPLRAIELFIETLSESRKKAYKLKNQENKTKKTNQNVPKKLYASDSKPCPKKYTFAPCRRLQALFTNKRKAYHECQKILLSKKIDDSKKGTNTNNSVFKKNKKSVTTNLVKVTRISSRRTYRGQENELERPRNIKSNRTNGVMTMMTSEVHEVKNNEDNLALATRSYWIYQKEPNIDGNGSTSNDEQNEITLLPNHLEQIKTAENVVESYKNMKMLVEDKNEDPKPMILSNNSDVTEKNQSSCSDDYVSEREMQMTENAKKISSAKNVRNCKSADSSWTQMKGNNTNKEINTVKIKIHWTQSCSNKPETTGENTYPFLVEGIEPQENLTPEISTQISDYERKLLDSLLVEEEKFENLERKSSVYFDAEESEREENFEKTDEQRFQEYSFTKQESLPSAELRDTVPLLENKRENLIVDKPENRWRKVLTLLEEVTKEIEKSTEEGSDDGNDNEGIVETQAMILKSKSESKISKVFNFIKGQTLIKTKTFWNRVKNNSTNDEGRESAQSSSFLPQISFRAVEILRNQLIKFSLVIFTNFIEIFLKLVNYLNVFKTKCNVEPENAERETKLSRDNPDPEHPSTWRELPVTLYQSKSVNLFETSSSGFLIHQTNNMCNIPEGLSELPLTDDDLSNRSLQVLKQQINKQRLLMQYLTNFSALPDVQLDRNSIIKKLEKLETVVSILEKTL